MLTCLFIPWPSFFSCASTPVFAGKPNIIASKPIHEYEALLADCHFVRVHKTFVVNLEHIKEYIKGEGGQVVLSNDDVVEVSRRKKDLLMARMKTYYKF